jgi:hypothetical protein
MITMLSQSSAKEMLYIPPPPTEMADLSTRPDLRHLQQQVIALQPKTLSGKLSSPYLRNVLRRFERRHGRDGWREGH